MKKRRAFKENLYVQPYRGIKDKCNIEGLGLPQSRSLDAALIELAREKTIGLDTLAYYALMRSRTWYLHKWAAAEAKELGVSPRTIERFRRELREARLMTTVRLGRQTYSVRHASQLSEEAAKRAFDIVYDHYLEQWKIERMIGSNFGIQTAAMVDFQSLLGDPHSTTFWILRRPLQLAMLKMNPETKGTERMKALGLWILLKAHQPPYHNWKSPANIAREWNLSAPTARKLCEHLETLGLFYYDTTRQAVGISQVPAVTKWNIIHPMSLCRRYRPWRWFGDMQRDREDMVKSFDGDIEESSLDVYLQMFDT